MVTVPMVFFLELFVPLAFFYPRKARIAAFYILTGFNVVTAFTSNYGFFNVLSIVIALFLLDDEHLEQLAYRFAKVKKFAKRVKVSAGDDADEKLWVSQAIWLAYSRKSTEIESSDGVAFIKQQIAMHRKSGRNDEEANQLALTDFCVVLFNTSQFVYVD